MGEVNQARGTAAAEENYCEANRKWGSLLGELCG